MLLSDDVVEMLKGGVALFAFMVVVSPYSVTAASEFSVQRLQQFHLNGNSFGEY